MRTVKEMLQQIQGHRMMIQSFKHLHRHGTTADGQSMTCSWPNGSATISECCTRGRYRLFHI